MIDSMVEMGLNEYREAVNIPVVGMTDRKRIYANPTYTMPIVDYPLISSTPGVMTQG